MTTRMNILYLFDPLCGWCYAAAPVVRALAEHGSVQPYATGLFADSGRMMDDTFAAHAWRNDQRIQALTGQPFSEAYRTQVLQQPAPFDSRPLTDAVSALLQQQTNQWPAALAALQHARYVDGRDTSRADVVRQVLHENGYTEAAATFDTPDNRTACAAWIGQGQAIMQQLGLHGVPQLLVQLPQGCAALPSEIVYGRPDDAAAAVAQFIDGLSN